MDEIWIDEYGFVWLGEFRLPFRLVGDELEFVDKDRRRCHERGGRYVRVDIEDMITCLKETKNVVL